MPSTYHDRFYLDDISGVRFGAGDDRKEEKPPDSSDEPVVKPDESVAMERTKRTEQ